jgi:subtilisin family serine protease
MRVLTTVVRNCAVLALSLLWCASIDGAELEPGLRHALRAADDSEMIGVIVCLRDQTDLDRVTASVGGRPRSERLTGVIAALQETADRSQRALLAALEREERRGRVAAVHPYWVFNGMALRATPAVIARLAGRPDISLISLDRPMPGPYDEGGKALPSTDDSEWNIAKVSAPQVWAAGYDGSGIVIGSFDTGVELSHPDLESRYRGGTNSWFDPYGQHSTPVDLAGSWTGHGTHTTGTVLGGNAGGTDIGVAPGAKWIAAKAWDDNGSGTTAAFLEIFEWMMDPDGDPATDDAPAVVNNSWGFTSYGCETTYLGPVQAWVAAGIFPSFAVHNYGPGYASARSPGNFLESIGVGNTDSNDIIYYSSGRGPSACDVNVVKPDVSAPGVDVRSSVPGGGYDLKSGTSMATPHVTGGVALLLDVNPMLSLEALESALKEGAVDLGDPGPDWDFGWGRIDLEASACLVLPEVSLFVESECPVVPPGGTLELTATLINRTGSPKSIWGIAEVFKPNGRPYSGNPIIGPTPVTLAPAETLVVHRSHHVPSGAPSGNYTYRAAIGTPPDVLLDDDRFDFEVTE